ncbi:hypothetical protein Q604_UNBC18632G0005 [human gut metagenome]|uniref:Helicase HerA central domain-containing protein n=1 Tax=human gut metagenome TaxID=408170 RepID=W1WPR5_9ZZZZ
MRYVINSIVELILNNAPSNNGEMMIRVDGFEDVKIYETLSRKLKDEFLSRELTIDIKLAKNKWNYFKQTCNESSVLQSLEQQGWVAEAESITYYRNLHTSNILVLLGTEDEEDKGGLRNCYTITPDTLIQYLSGNYHEIFGNINEVLSTIELDIIDKLYKDLFEFIPIDLCKLSNLIDSWKDIISNINDFIELFYESLPQWGLPFRKLHLPTVRDFKKKSNILRMEYNFINRQMFKKMSMTQYKKYLLQIDYYNEQTEEYSAEWEGWNTQGIKSYEEFSQTLKGYIIGENVALYKEKLLNTDFSIIESVIDIKLPKNQSKPIKKTIPTLTGEPLEVFTKALLYTLSDIKSEDIKVDKICFDIIQAEIVSMYCDTENEEEKQQLLNTWNTICRHTNGVVEYLNKRMWQINESEIELSCTPINVFSPQYSVNNIEDGIVKAANANKSISKINIVVKCYSNSGSEIEFVSQEYQWKFEGTSAWLHNFFDICNQDFCKSEDGNFIPMGIINKINSLLFAKSEEEFFDLYDESDMNLDFNLGEYIDEKATETAIEYSARFDKLGHSFVKFVYAIANEGFYTCIGKNNSELTQLIRDYTELGDYLTSKTLPENLKWLLNVYIHAFNIESSIKIIKNDIDAESCIVPAWHPATLEKINDQKIFFLDGCEEWWNHLNNEESKINFNMIESIISNLKEMSKVQCSLDVFPSYGQQYFGSINAFGSFSLYGRNDIKNNNRLKDMIHKDAIFDDDFNNNEIAQMNDNAKMIYGVIDNYSKAFPNSYSNLSIVFIDPSELQPIIASVYKYIEIIRKKYPTVMINIQLRILVKPENKGGRNYLAYWMDEFFSQDANVNIRTYLNEWRTKSDLDNFLDGNNDIVFVMDLLKVNNLQFIKENKTVKLHTSQCRFPIVLKPAPISATTIKRRIELSQPQFSAAYAHTQVVKFINAFETVPDGKYIAVREVCIDREVQEIVYSLHEKAYWVVCVDSGMDGALLRNDTSHKGEYSIIGFSTGKGEYGQYNLTITTRKTILNTIRNKFKSRLYQLFKWEKNKINKAAQICLNEASDLDGISLFSAINQKDHNINEFMAYVLTSLRENKQNSNELKIIIHLDSYKHWFSSQIEKDKDNSMSRPDFLILEANISENDNIKLKATIAECKISSEIYADEHKIKALKQVNHGIQRLSTIFDPSSKSIKRRYWYAQLYRALAFAQVTFNDNTEEFAQLSSKLRSILDGKFEIEWNGEILGFWLDMNGDKEIESKTGINNIKIFDIPQICIQQLLLDSEDFSEMDYINIDNSLIIEEKNQEEEIAEREKEIEDEIKNIQKTRKKPDVNKDINNKEIKQDSNVESKVDGIKDNKTLEIKDNNYAKVNTGNIDKQRDVLVQNKVSKENESNRFLEDIRVLIGTNKLSEKVFWEFGHSELANRHMLITGTSGQGKTYAIQTMLYELSKNSISSVVFDYTEGFRLDQLESEFVTKMENKITQNIIKVTGVPINPFKQHEIEIVGMKILEPVADVAARFANILIHVYGFGDQQFSAIFEATRIGLEKYGEDMDMIHFKDELELVKNSNSSAKTVLSKMAPFFYSITFNKNDNFDWNEVLYSNNAQLNIFQLTLIDREMQVIITELMLWDVWYFTKKHGSKEKPFVVVLDEAQNLSHKDNSPSKAILTEGRKFGWSAWFATQSLKVLSDDEVVRLLQSSFKLYFKPTDDEITKMSKQLDPRDASTWLTPLKNLKKGQCIVVGERIKQDGRFGSVKPTITNVLSFEERS